MKKFLSFLITIFTSLLVTKTVNAQFNQGQIQSPIPDNIFKIVGNITSLIPAIIIIVFFAIMVYAGFLRMTAGADQEQEAKAMRTLTGGIIGFIIVALSAVIVSIVSQILKINPLF
jgi:predicted ABC-type exoprotein transport system permease subunit